MMTPTSTWNILCGVALGAVLLAVPPARAADKAPAPEGKTDEKTADAKDEAGPIKQLAELRIDERVVPARMINLPLPGRTRTLQDILDRFDEWSKNERIGHVLLDLGSVNLGFADVQELRSGLDQLREAGKRVTAYLNGASPYAYLLACGADEIVIAPSGFMAIPGIGGVFPFMKGYYQLVGIEWDVITAGRFKYPGFLNERAPNKYFKEEYAAILDSWIGDYKRMIADRVTLDEDAAGKAVNVGIFNADQALQHGLVDTIAFQHECRERILSREKLKEYKGDEPSLAHVNSIQDIMELVNTELRRQEEARKAVGPKIAVLHARGPIIDISLGAGFASQVISRDDFVEVIDELRKNKSIKAVVMRVDSPGGSAYASDVIWKALRRLDEEKPLVVSMGTVAGSGGYYIACPARRIFAQPTTITGSIGVLGIIPSAISMFNRMDYELAEMSRGERATLGSPHKELSKEDRKLIQEWIDTVYDQFIGRVAGTRRIPEAEVRKIAEGRIYTGRDALELHLVDELGGLNDAIESARAMANIPPSAELKIIHYPRASSLGEIFESFSVAAPGLAAGGALSVERVLGLFSGATTPSVPVTFDRQLSMLTQRFQPLCWMAVPPFYTVSAPAGLPGGAALPMPNGN
jgi:protease-4